MAKPFVFIFRITSACDKKCEACCNGQQNPKSIPFEDFIKKLKDMQSFIENEKLSPVIGFTGGEPFFYYDANGKKDIYSLVSEIRERIPSAEVLIRTSGWKENVLLDKRFTSLFKLATKAQINISFGFNLFQQQGRQAKERLAHMLSLLLTYQDRIIMDVIYHKLNIAETIDIIEKGLGAFHFRYRGIGQNILSEPSTPHRFISKHRESEKQIIMNAYPAYNACQQSNNDHFFEDSVSCGICNEIKFGPTQLFYMDDLSIVNG